MSRSRLSLSIFIVILLGSLACNTPFGGDQTTPTNAPVILTNTPPLPTSLPPNRPTTEPSQPPSNLPPTIYEAGFTSDPEAGLRVTQFRQGVKEIWAVMGYFGMHDGLTFKRVWYKDGEVFIEREEPWDFTKYGSEGKVKDISIYDRDAGLPVGHYELEVFIDGVNQNLNNGDSRVYFDIVPTPTGTTVYKSPSGAKSVLLELPGTLRLACELCDDAPLAEHASIAAVYWFPDEQHVLYVVVDQSEQGGAELFLDDKTELWIVDIINKKPYRISEASENFRGPLISPQGETIAVEAGTGYCDAGMCDSGLVFIQLEDYERVGAKRADEFGGMEAAVRGATYPFGGPNYQKLGEWVSATEFVAPMSSTFEAPDFNPGMYRFNLSTLTAERIGDLPPQ